MYAGASAVEHVPRGTKIRVRFDLRAENFLKSLCSQIAANVSQFQSHESVTQSATGGSIPYHIPLIELNSGAGVQFTHATVANVCALYGGIEGKILPSCTVAGNGEVRLHVDSADVMEMGKQLSAALPGAGNTNWYTLNQSGLHVSIGIFMGVHIAEFQSWLNQELSGNTPMFPNFHTDFVEFSEEWVQTVFPHRTLPLTGTGGGKVRSNSETDHSVASAGTYGSTEEKRRGSSTASPYGFDIVSADGGASTTNHNSGLGGLSGMEGLLGNMSVGGGVGSDWGVDSDVGVFGGLGSGASSVHNLERAGSVRSGSITSLHSENELGSLTGSVQDSAEKVPAAQKGAMSYAQASGGGGTTGSAGNGGRGVASTGVSSPAKAWSQPGSFLAAASAANKPGSPAAVSTPDASGKPPAGPTTAVRKPVAPATSTAAVAAEASATTGGDQGGSEIDSSKAGGTGGDGGDRGKLGRKPSTSSFKCKTNRPAKATAAPARAGGPSGGGSGGSSGGGAPASGVRKPVDREVRDGDWVCGTCGGHNFANKIACFTCRTPRPEGYVLDTSTKDKSSEKKPGDWTCPKCGGNVFAKRTRCYVCSHSRNAPL